MLTTEQILERLRWRAGARREEEAFWERNGDSNSAEREGDEADFLERLIDDIEKPAPE